MRPQYGVVEIKMDGSMLVLDEAICTEKAHCWNVPHTLHEMLAGPRYFESNPRCQCGERTWQEMNKPR